MAELETTATEALPNQRADACDVTGNEVLTSLQHPRKRTEMLKGLYFVNGTELFAQIFLITKSLRNPNVSL